MSEGISHVLYVIDGRFTVKEINTFNMINDSIFKSGVLDYVTIVRTKFSNFRNEEECEKSMKQTREGNKLVAEIVNSCNEEDDDDYKDRILVNKNARKKVKKEGIRLLGRNIYISNQKIEEYYQPLVISLQNSFLKLFLVEDTIRRRP
uniref:Uncharacterized protein n=1 Tax=Rhizophagus irregularis (strain DAOM 181602 / DAOM 197198 / MUCL 43194) TaxID=747089 RepID=U9U8Q3_RHIID